MQARCHRSPPCAPPPFGPTAAVADQEEPEFADVCGLDAVRTLCVADDPPHLDNPP
jgi:hypothetical protein